jgi:hypothetical protein
VKVSRHSDRRYGLVNGEFVHSDQLEHKWCLYAFIFPKHPHFSKFEGNSMWQDAAAFYDWHCGCTYLEYHRNNDGQIVSVQVGCDYNHLYDGHFLDMATKEDARSVFGDADELFETLTRLGVPQ